jgi:hypothetical protein
MLKEESNVRNKSAIKEPTIIDLVLPLPSISWTMRTSAVSQHGT